jgi:hypothetical protein
MVHGTHGLLQETHSQYRVHCRLQTPDVIHLMPGTKLAGRDRMKILRELGSTTFTYFD